MPLIHIAMRAGKPAAYRQAIFDTLYRAMRETFNVPEDDQFMTLTEHDAANFRYSPSYLGVARSDDVVFIQITANNTRTLEQKKALFQRIAQLLGESPALRRIAPARAARAVAMAVASAAMVASTIMPGLLPLRPVPRLKRVSPSDMVCTGLMLRASPS